VRKADNFTTILCCCHENFLEPSGPLQACNGTALPLLCVSRHSLTNMPVTFRMVQHKSELSMHVVNYICIYKGVQLKSKLQHVKPDQPQHDHSTACVIAQQYSSSTLSHWAFIPARKNLACV